MSKSSMNALNLTSSVLTIIGAFYYVPKVFDQIESIRRSRDNVLSLMSELSELQSIIQEIESHHQNADFSGLSAANTILPKALERARAKVEELYNLITEQVVSSSGLNDFDFSRIQWIKYRGKIGAFRTEIHTARLDLCMLMQDLILRQNYKILPVLESLTLKVDGLLVGQEARENQNERNTKLLVSNMTDSSTNILSGILKSQALFEEHLTSTRQSRLLSAISENIESSKASRGFAPRKNTGFLQATALQPSCQLSCSCSCHVFTQFRTSSTLSQFFGNLFIEYSASPSPKQICNEQSCSQKSRSSIRVIYSFPEWIFMKCIVVSASLNSINGPALWLRTAVVRHHRDEVFYLAYDGDVGGIQKLFSEGQASPNDMTHTTHTSLLQLAIDQGHFELVKYLLDKGADPHNRSVAKRTPMSIGWQKVFIENSEELKALLISCDDDDHPTTQGFSIIHKIILDLIQGDLKTELERSTATINDSDVNGNTALSWAAIRGDHLSVIRLLRRGASPEIATTDGKIPLHMAALAQSRACVKILTKHTADINTQDSYGNTALHYIVKKPSSSQIRTESINDCIKHLLDHGADVNRQDLTGKTPLRYCVDSNNIEAALLLLESGVAIEKPTLDGMNPVHAAIYYNRCEMLCFLGEKGAFQKPGATSSPGFQTALSKATAETKSVLDKFLDIDATGGRTHRK